MFKIHLEKGYFSVSYAEDYSERKKQLYRIKCEKQFLAKFTFRKSNSYLLGICDIRDLQRNNSGSQKSIFGYLIQFSCKLNVTQIIYTPISYGNCNNFVFTLIQSIYVQLILLNFSADLNFCKF